MLILSHLELNKIKFKVGITVLHIVTIDITYSVFRTWQVKFTFKFDYYFIKIVSY